MTDRLSLFEEMTAAADALRRDNPELREGALFDELQLTFREIQKRRMPELSTVEWLDLFKSWGLEYVAKCERRREAAVAGMIATIDEYARANVPEDPFVCPGCGEVLDDPCNPTVMAVHQPHYLAAKAARR